MDIQDAFNIVSDQVAKHCTEIVMGGNAATSGEDCLKYLSNVCTSRGYDASRINAFLELLEEQNRFLDDFCGEF